MHQNYIVFARKYRPKDFYSLYYGQDALAKTLSYAIINNRLASGYLLTGIRGVGKTSTARIIAKTANCISPLVSDQYNIKACDNCENCTNFNHNAHPDIVEIDAASHTGVDDIREIIASAEYRPILGQFKFYIIDEVHMLSKNAFNALLKLLEEPPQHTIFVLATTEVNKIPLTIISRCQRFDLRRLSNADLLALTTNICSEENISYQPAALELLCAKADGSARDALSLLDQAYALTKANNDSEITIATVRQLTNCSDPSILLSFIDALVNIDAKAILEIINDVASSAPGLSVFFENILDAIAFMSKAKLITDYHDYNWGEVSKNLQEYARQTPLSRLTIIWQIASKGLAELKTTHNLLLSAEMLAIRLLYANSIPELSSHFSDELPQLNIDNARSPAKAVIQSSHVPQPQESLADFLTYLKEKRAFDLLYSLMNESSVVSFQSGLLELSSNKLDGKFKTQLESLLKDWSKGNLWQVMISDSKGTMTLKAQLVAKASSSPEWKKIVAAFNDAKIIDITF